MQTAAELMLLAAKQGNSDAQHDIGLMYMLGEGVSQDHQKSIQWWEKAAAQGNASAANNIGLTYLEGRGGSTKDNAAAVSWLRKAVVLGSGSAAFNLGFEYVQGTAVQQNNVLAYLLFLIATKLGNDDGPTSARRMESILTKNQIAEGKTLASAWSVGKPIPTTAKTLPH